MRPRRIVPALLVTFSLTLAPAALAQDTFSISDFAARYAANFPEPGIAEDVPKNIFTFENTAGGRKWSSYMFVDVLRSWSEADANAKEVYGETGCTGTTSTGSRG